MNPTSMELKSDREIVIARTFNGPAHIVFDAWTKPELVKRWWAPGRGAIGLVSTHDLALTDIAGLEEGALHNVHFQDELHDGRMYFDFKLREGVVTKSNAIELMRSVGLEV